MGWTGKWVSSCGSDFNFDFHVSFTPDALASGKIEYNYATITDPKYHHDELPGHSVFFKDTNGDVFHTYSSYARGNEEIRDWVRRHDEYEDAPKSDSCCGEAKQTSAA